jgi:hypothetical protein
MFPHGIGLMHRGSSRPRPIRDRDALLAGDDRWSFGELDREQRARPHLAAPRHRARVTAWRS